MDDIYALVERVTNRRDVITDSGRLSLAQGAECASWRRWSRWDGMGCGGAGRVEEVEG